MEEYKLMCYFVTNDGSEGNRKAIFEQPNDSMTNHFKPFVFAIFGCQVIN